MEFRPSGFCFQRQIVVRNALGTEPTRGLAREEICGVESEQNFGKDSFDAGLPRFAGDGICDVVTARVNRVSETEQRRAAFAERTGYPFFLCLACAFENSGQIASAGGLKARDDFVCGGIDRIYKARLWSHGDRERMWSHGHDFCDCT